MSYQFMNLCRYAKDLHICIGLKNLPQFLYKHFIKSLSIFYNLRMDMIFENNQRLFVCKLEIKTLIIKFCSGVSLKVVSKV